MLEVLKALGDESRLRIVHLLLQGPLCVCELEYVLQMSQTNVSRHLAKLKQANVVQNIKQGQWVNYQMDGMFLATEAKLVAFLKEKFANAPSFQEDLRALLAHQIEHNSDCSPSRKILQEKSNQKGVV